MSDAWAGIFRVEEESRVENNINHSVTMSGKCQDGDGDSLDGGASSSRAVGDTGRRFRWCADHL
jgi:hypothetical protein